MILPGMKRKLQRRCFLAWVDDSGTVNFRKDIYGHDEKMENVMFEAEDVYPVEKQIN